MNLETQVRDRNLNPKSACIKRRSDSGSDVHSQQHLNSFNPQNPNQNDTEPVVSLIIIISPNLVSIVFVKVPPNKQPRYEFGPGSVLVPPGSGAESGYPPMSNAPTSSGLNGQYHMSPYHWKCRCVFSYIYPTLLSLFAHSSIFCTGFTRCFSSTFSNLVFIPFHRSGVSRYRLGYLKGMPSFFSNFFRYIFITTTTKQKKQNKQSTINQFNSSRQINNLFMTIQPDAFFSTKKFQKWYINILY